MLDNKQWIWQQKQYPNFTYDKNKLEPLLLDIKYHQGLLNGIYTSINKEDIAKTQVEVFTQEAMDTSAIEGETLSRDSVRSSISKKLGINTNLKDNSSIQTDGVIDVLFDATINYNKNFTAERLFGWHNALFPTGYSGMHKIDVAKYRGSEDMQIVSGPIGKEKIHYLAPPRDILEKEMKQFFSWINKNDDISIIKAGIAHLWFVIIHPLDDGNGRCARALTDMIIAREANSSQKLYSMSNAINSDKNGYYEVLEKTTTGNGDITLWLEWFLQTLLNALKNAKKNINHILQKTSFWDKHRNTVLNERQIKVLNRLLDAGVGNFQGGINTRKYASLTKTSKPTASREIKDLVDKKCLIKISGTAGRNISYEVKM